MSSSFVSRIQRAASQIRPLCTRKPRIVQPTPRDLDSQRGVLELVDSGKSAGARRNGRAWRTSELRLKSFDDLHKLWFILLKERNILLSEKAWCKTNGRYWVNGHSNLLKVKQSMARIKGVIGERERALKAKRAAEALRAETEGRGLADAVEEDADEAVAAVTRTSPSN